MSYILIYRKFQLIRLMKKILILELFKRKLTMKKPLNNGKLINHQNLILAMTSLINLIQVIKFTSKKILSFKIT